MPIKPMKVAKPKKFPKRTKEEYENLILWGKPFNKRKK